MGYEHFSLSIFLSIEFTWLIGKKEKKIVQHHTNTSIKYRVLHSINNIILKLQKCCRHLSIYTNRVRINYSAGNHTFNAMSATENRVIRKGMIWARFWWLYPFESIPFPEIVKFLSVFSKHGLWLILLAQHSLSSPSDENSHLPTHIKQISMCLSQQHFVFISFPLFNTIAKGQNLLHPPQIYFIYYQE